jgi:thioredoxin-dependent peroxiredoxin
MGLKTLFFLFFVLGIAGFAGAGKLLKPGDPAPDFTAKDQDGKAIKLFLYKGKKNVVLYFYPKDFTGGCTAEACAFRDNYEVFVKKGAVVIGVSADQDESHRKFIQTNSLPFRLISDPKGELAAKYGVGAVMGMMDRVTFIIGKSGKIKFVYSSMKDAVSHVNEAMKALETADKGAK